MTKNSGHLSLLFLKVEDPLTILQAKSRDDFGFIGMIIQMDWHGEKSPRNDVPFRHHEEDCHVRRGDLGLVSF